MLKFVNYTNWEVWLAYMFRAQDVCGGEGGDWQAIGWYYMPPYGDTVPYANSLGDVGNRYWCFYAENAYGDFWAGPYPVYVPDDNSAFNHCYMRAGTSSRVIGMRLFDVGDNDDFVLSLTP